MWKVVPLSQAQLLDVNPDDVLEGGLYRKCDTYRGGGGYDQFPAICERMLGRQDMSRQFVVQLFGCNLDCPYCYVTRAGVWGPPVQTTTDELLEAFERSGQDVFHLMGGAPAIHLAKWPELVTRFEQLFPHNVFHSDMLLTERSYKAREVAALATVSNLLVAVDVKGVTPEEHFANTRKPSRRGLFWKNMVLLAGFDVPFYVTFTNVSRENVGRFWWEFSTYFDADYTAEIRGNAFSIDLIDYKATPHVDAVPWGPVWVR